MDVFLETGFGEFIKEIVLATAAPLEETEIITVARASWLDATFGFGVAENTGDLSIGEALVNEIKLGIEWRIDEIHIYGDS